MPKTSASFTKRRVWALAPAYDLTQCSNGYNGEHATSVNNHGNPTIEDMLVVGESIRISRTRGKNMILSMAEKVLGYTINRLYLDSFKEIDTSASTK